jgi:hypothetical protein
MLHIRTDVLDSAYGSIFNTLRKDGVQRFPRSLKTYDIGFAVIELERNPHMFVRQLNHSKILAYGELMLILQGTYDARAYQFYSKEFSKYVERGKVPGAYGRRMQWSHVRKTLMRIKDDPDTRRACVAIYTNTYDLPESQYWEKDRLDVACNLMLHFEPANEKLNLNVFSRSTDFRRGFVYDVTMWSLLLAIAADWCELKPGLLRFTTASLHLYDSDVVAIEAALKQNGRLVEQKWGTPSKQDDAISTMLLNEMQSRDGMVPHRLNSRMSTVQLLPLIQHAKNTRNVPLLESLTASTAWKSNEEYYVYAAGRMLA